MPRAPAHRPRIRGSLAGACSCALALMPACSDRVLGPLHRFDQPTGLALSPRGGWLLVSNGNWDQGRLGSSLVALDLDALEAALASPREPGEKLALSAPCRRLVGEARVECDPELLIDAERGVRLASGAGNVLVDAPDVERGTARILVPSRIDPTVTWVDIVESSDGELRLECGRDLDAYCDARHVIDELADEPGNLSASLGGGRFAFLPHLLQRDPSDCDDRDDPRCSGMDLIDLRAARGPALADVAHGFFRTDPLFDSGLAGGFAVAERPCDEANPPDLSRDCTRPVLYATQRYWFGLRMFSIAPETQLISGGSSVMLQPNNLDAARPLPLNGDLAFEDADHLLVVHTTPPAISRIDTSVDEEGDPRNLISRTASLCSNPNHLELWQPEASSAFAFVSCYGDGRVTALRLPDLEAFRTLQLGQGANELLVDPQRRWLFVANVIEDSVSVVSLDLEAPNYMREIATLGLGHRRDASP